MKVEFLPLHEEAKKWQCLLRAFKSLPLEASAEEIIAFAEGLRRSK